MQEWWNVKKFPLAVKKKIQTGVPRFLIRNGEWKNISETEIRGGIDARRLR